MEAKVTVVDGYETLHLALTAALNRAQAGKGLKRHATLGESFTDQIGMEITCRVGLGFPLGQAIKKIVESRRLSIEEARGELLDAIVYIGMAVVSLDETGGDIGTDPSDVP